MSFQFPSNGKAHRKSFDLYHAGHAAFVSIPFKRESTAKEMLNITIEDTRTLEFQFPSNGKAQRKRRPQIWQLPGLVRFNSLQTGKHSERVSELRSESSTISVSIPFKRESTAKGRALHGVHR